MIVESVFLNHNEYALSLLEELGSSNVRNAKHVAIIPNAAIYYQCLVTKRQLGTIFAECWPAAVGTTCNGVQWCSSCAYPAARKQQHGTNRTNKQPVSTASAVALCVRPKQLLKEPQDKREGTSTIRRVWHVCGGLLVGFTLPSAIDFQSRWVLDITHGTPCACPNPKYLLTKNLLPKKYLGSKYFSSSRFLGNIARVKFWREIIPENIPCKTLFAAPEKNFTQI